MSSDPRAAFAAALRHHQAGDLSRAATAYQAVLQANPGFAPAHHYLGLIAYQQGDPARAVSLVERALALQPGLTEARYNLGNIFREQGQRDEAERSYRAVIQAEPANPAALHNLAALLKERGALAEAEALLRRLIAAAPNYPAGHAALGVVLSDADRPAEAITHLRRAAELAPGDSSILYNLGRALFANGEAGEAEEQFRASLRLNARDAEACHDLGQTLLAQHRYGEAIELYQDLARRHPDNSNYLRRFGNSLHAGGQVTAAIETYQRALALDPEQTKIHTNLGNALLQQGRVDESVEAHRRALASDPRSALALSNLLFALNFQETADPQEVFAEHRRFDALHGAPLAGPAEPFGNSRETHRRLRVGYLSPDFRHHPGGLFLLPVFEHRDREQVEIFAYSTSRQGDSLTARFRQSADHWREVGGLSDEGLAALIRNDRIDILVECAGHMAGTRLLVCARNPAPVQVSFPIYPNTTGLSAIRYRIMDPYFAPPAADVTHSETLVRLPDVHVCYQPTDPAAEPSEALPCTQNGVVTFASFNNIAKLNPRTTALWARLLNTVPRARLILKAPGLDDGAGSWITARFRELGVPPERLQLAGRSESPYAPYRDVDICLDPLHANGGTTTCDALWMGVPVVTLPGETPFSRVGLCHLTNIGMTEWVAADEDSYIAIAAGLATDPARLTRARSGLRERVARSPLMDGSRYTRHLENAFREMWMEWCRSG